MIDEAVPILLSSTTIVEFLNGLGFELRVDLTSDEFHKINKSQMLSDGSPSQHALICNSNGGSNLVVADKPVWTCDLRLHLLQAEYSYAKNIK